MYELISQNRLNHKNRPKYKKHREQAFLWFFTIIQSDNRDNRAPGQNKGFPLYFLRVAQV
jgi:hypothetical protein